MRYVRERLSGFWGFIEAEADDAMSSLLFGRVELVEGGEEFGFGHAGIGKGFDVEIGEELGEGLVAEKADDFGF